MKRIFTIGGATQDIFIIYEDAETLHLLSKKGKRSFLLLEQGLKIDINSLSYATGGGATNSAIGFKRLGLEVSTYFKVGADKQGQYIQEILKKEGIDIKDISISPEIVTATSFIIPAPNKDYTALIYRGPNAHIIRQDLPLKNIAKSDWLYITSLSGDSAELLPYICSFAKEHNVKTAINPGMSQITTSSQFLYDSLQYTDILILNCIESQKLLTSILKTHYESSAKQLKASLNYTSSEEEPKLLQLFMIYSGIKLSLAHYFYAIMQLGPKIVVLTNGSEGVYICLQNIIYFHPGISTELVSTVGAGDAFGSCFVGSLALEKTIEQAIIYGVINSSSVLTHLDAKTGLLALKELEKRAKLIGSSQIQKFSLKKN